MKNIFTILLLACVNFTSKLNAQVITTICGNGTNGFSGDGGIATSAELYRPGGIAIDALGNIFITDRTNNRIRKVNTSGIITTIAGTGPGAYSGDGGPATAAEINWPASIAIDVSGNLYIADTYNNCIRMINNAGVINTIAGTGVSGYSGDGGLAIAAKLNNPWGIALDSNGNLFVADYGNHRIRIVNTSGIINTLAGTGTAGYTGDGGQAIAAELGAPSGIALDASNNVYIADYSNHCVRRVDAIGIISTVAGNGMGGYLGDGGQATSAKLHYPLGITIDESHNLYIADYYNNVIRKVNTTDTISTIAGIGTIGYSGDGGPATTAELNNPSGVALDGYGNLYITDTYNNRVRKIANAGQTTTIKQLIVNNEQVKVYPNPSNVAINITSSITMDECKVTDMFGQLICESSPKSTNTSFFIQSAGIYFISVICGKEISIKKVVVYK